MQVGCIGDIVFLVSSNYIKTFKDLTWTTRANIAEHSIAYGQSVAEFTGSGLETVSMKVQFSASLGVVSPLAEVEKVRNHVRAGTASKLVIGEFTLGGLWVISDLSLSAKFYNKWGTPTTIDATLTLKEYGANASTSTTTEGIIT